MISRLNGTVVEKSTMEIIVDCNGVGYSVAVAVATSEKVTLNENTVLFTHLAVREDAMQLFGFSTKQERDIFLQLISISGIGGKTALAILSAASVEELHSAITHKNSSFLQKLPGIGKKTAERIVLELQDKISSIASSSMVESLAQGISFVQNDALSAMVSLGYNKLVAEKAVRAAITEHPTRVWTADLLLREALKKIV